LDFATVQHAYIKAANTYQSLPKGNFATSAITRIQLASANCWAWVLARMLKAAHACA
jgi:hypothetical protein